MPIPFSTTTVNITRAPSGVDVDLYDEPATAGGIAVASAVRAVITTPSAQTDLTGGDRVVYNATMRCDTCPVQQADTVVDNVTGQSWTVLNVIPQPFAFGFMIVQLREVTGAAAV